MQALGSCQGAAWLVDLTSGAIIAATPAGEIRLGLGRAIPSPVVDAAMPALARLRALAATAGPKKREQERLVYWTPQGAVTVVGAITFIPADHEPLFAIVEEQSASPPGADTSQECARLPPPPDDAAKLKEIARRIRAAQERLANGGVDTPADTASDTRADERPREAGLEPPAAELVAKLAHELRTPLSAIAAAAEIMKDERLGPVGNPRYHGYLTDIHGSARHALGVVERMLGGASTKEALAFAEVDLNEIAAALASQMVPLAEAAGLKLVLDLDQRLPRIIADTTSLRQILLNLLTNSIKFTARGGRITVCTAYELAGPLKIEIVDTGKGMSRREIVRYVDGVAPPALESREGGGFGIGLALVRTLAKANGARLLIESQPGKGTRAAIVFAKDRVVPV